MDQRTDAGSGATAPQAATPPAVVFDGVSLAFDDQIVLRDISFTVAKGAMRVVLGASGTGKSVMLKLMLGLIRPDSGTIVINGERVDNRSELELLRIRADMGIVFQELALFDSLTVAENVGYRLYEESDLPLEDVRRRVEEVLGFVGLTEFIDRMPATLSGGQRRRVAIARAMASQPSLMLLDDPTTGLDPIIATTVVDEIVKLRDLQRVTSLFVTHQIRDAFYIATHRAVRRGDRIDIESVAEDANETVEFMVLNRGRIHFEGSGAELLASQDRYLQEFLLDTLPPW
jgi:phospholipid/cholesterol/gamma-HCH transport system ATP-binding protein